MPRLGGSEAVFRICYNYIFEALHSKLFTPSDDEQLKSQQIKDKVSLLRKMITPEMLGLKTKLLKIDYIALAVAELSKLNDFKSPFMKVAVLESTVKAVQVCLGMDSNAETLFPVLVYVTLQANVDLLFYNLQLPYQIHAKTSLSGQNDRTGRLHRHQFHRSLPVHRNHQRYLPHEWTNHAQQRKNQSDQYQIRKLKF